MRYLFIAATLIASPAFAQGYPANSPMAYEQRYMQQVRQQSAYEQQMQDADMQGHMAMQPQPQQQVPYRGEMPSNDNQFENQP